MVLCAGRKRPLHARFQRKGPLIVDHVFFALIARCAKISHRNQDRVGVTPLRSPTPRLRQKVSQTHFQIAMQSDATRIVLFTTTAGDGQGPGPTAGSVGHSRRPAPPLCRRDVSGGSDPCCGLSPATMSPTPRAVDRCQDGADVLVVRSPGLRRRDGDEGRRLGGPRYGLPTGDQTGTRRRF